MSEEEITKIVLNSPLVEGMPTYNELQQENKELKDNWNKLKKYIEERGESQKINNTQINGMVFTSVGTMLCRNILDKMKDLGGDK